MPLALLPAIIGAGATLGGGLLAKKASDNASKAQAGAMSPLIQAQTDAAKWNLDQAKIDIPKARETLGGPLAFWNKILTGDRNAAMSVAGPSADMLAAQTAAANRAQSEFSPRGGRRALMLGDKPLEVVTSLNRGLLELRPRAAEEAKSIGQILANLGLGESGVAVNAGSSAIAGQTAASNLALQSAAQSGAIMKDLGSNIGGILRLLMTKKSGGDTSTGGTLANIGWLPGHEIGHSSGL